MCEYDAKNKIVQIAYKKGFIRIGINRREKVIGVEGYPKALKNRMQQIKLIVEKFNNENGEEYTLSVNPIK